MNTLITKGNYQIAADVFGGWRDDVLTGTPPVLYKVGEGGLGRIEIGPKLVTLIGGAPGAGKTAFSMQCVVDALRLDDSIRACVCNIEMPAEVLLDRQLARLSGVDARSIRYRDIGAEHAERLDAGMNTLDSIADRLCFLKPPFDLDNVAASADAFDADIIVLDYIQRIPPPGKQNDRRGSIDASMGFLRQWADAGIAVVVVAAVARQRNNRGQSSYDSLSLASFRESSELEFGADDAFILVSEGFSSNVTLKHLKARHTEPRDMFLRFDRNRQSFTAIGDDGLDSAQPDNDLQAELSSLWETTEAAPEGGDDAESK